MHPEEYLMLIRKLNILINNELLDKEQLFTLATKTTQELDDMPHAHNASDKVGNIAVKIMQKEQEIDHIIDILIDLRDEIKEQIRTLPDNECDVLFRFYVLGMKLPTIAEEMNYSVDWIKKLKNRAMYHITVVESEAFKSACKLLKI